MKSEEAAITAYQIGFDLYENATQQFLHRVILALSRSPNLGHLMESPKAGGSDAAAKKEDPATGETEEKPAEGTPASAAETPVSESDKVLKKRLELLNSILNGDKVSTPKK